MSLIQFLILAASFASFALYLSFFRSVLKDRLIAVLLFAGAIAATLFPDATTALAHALGVGRGTDLVLYIFAMGSLYVGLLFYGKLARLERSLTDLAREIAIAQVRPQGKNQ